MDAWNPDQLKRMQLGGNGQFNAFMAKYGVAKNTEIKQKYNTKAAEIYREVIRAQLEGRAYTPPSQSEVAASQPAPPPRAASAGSFRREGSRAALGSGGTDWGAWEEEKPAASGGSYSTAALAESASNKDAFFARRMAENASKPDHLPPSQGGKYVGFGSTPAPVSGGAGAGNGANVDDVTRLLNKGLTGLGSLASVARGRAADLQARYQDGTLADQTQAAAEKAKEAGARGWGFLKDAYAKAASQLEATAAANGYRVDLGARRVSESVASTNGSSRYGGFGSDSVASNGYAPPRAASASGGRGYSALRQADEDFDPGYGQSGARDSFSSHPAPRSGHMTHAASAPAFGDASRPRAGRADNAGFGGFDEDEDQWGGEDAWHSAAPASKAAAPASKPASRASSKPTASLLDVDPPQAEDDHQDWGKW